MPQLYVMHHATCARKALFALLEKGADLPTVEVDRAWLVTPAYRAMNPDGVVPTLLLDDGSALVESSVIMRYIDEACEGPSLQPADPLRRARMNLWMKWVDEKYFPALGAPTIATFMRKVLAGDEARIAAMLDAQTDYVTRLMREECVRVGPAAGFVDAGLTRLREMLEKMEETLSGHAWLAGDEISLADCAMAPLVLRIAEFGLAPAWETRLPAFTDWWNRIAARPAMTKLLALADQALLTELTSAVEEARPYYLSRLS